MKLTPTPFLSSVLVLLLVAAPARAAESKVDQAVKKAYEAVDKGKADEAQKTAEKMLKDGKPEDLTGASRVFARLGKLDDAIAASRKAAASPSTGEIRAQVLAQLASMELRVGSGRDALAHAREAKGLSTSPEVQAAYIRSLARAKDPAALAAAEALVKAAPTAAASHDARGRALTAEERYDEADAAFAKAIELDPKLWRAYLHRVMAKIEAGKAAEAEPMARKLTEMDKNQPEGWTALGAAIITQDAAKWQSAVDPAQQGVFLAAHSAYAQYWAGWIFEKAGNNNEALAAYKRAVETDPVNAKARMALLRHLRAADDTAGATEAGALIDDFPLDPEVQLYAGKTLLQLGNYAAALAPLERAAERRSKSPEANAMLGDAYRANRQWAQASEVYKKAIALAPNDINYQRLYGLCLAGARKCGEAAPLLEKAARLQPSEAGEAFFQLGWCQFQVGRDSENKDLKLSALENARKAMAKGHPKGERLVVIVEESLGNRRRLGGTPFPEPVAAPTCDLAALYKEAASGPDAKRAAAIRKMVCAGTEAVKYLVQYLGDATSYVVRIASARTLTGIGAPAKEACTELGRQMEIVQKDSALGGNKKLSSDDEAKLMHQQGDFLEAARTAREKIGCK
jgi:tetratricopeptide (TPR) repeat protein